MALNIFDEIYCLTLPESPERHNHISRELNDKKITSFSFHIGYGPDSHEVNKAFSERRVANKEQCFRCHHETCKCGNNILIRSQVACFLSYLDIFNRAVNSGKRTFVCLEDDVIISSNYLLFGACLLNSKSLSKYGFYSDEPALLKMGSPRKCTSVSISAEEMRSRDWILDSSEMSNTMFAFNLAFAKLALKNSEQINSTSDIYIHRDLALVSSSHKLPVQFAHDLSWSEKKIPSLIHPKAPGIKNIMNPIRFISASQKFLNHHKSCKSTSYLIAGIPRGGTGWAAAAAKRLGLEISHERLGGDGMSSWCLAGKDYPMEAPFGEDFFSKNPYYIKAKTKILVVRPLHNALGSQVIENQKSPTSFNYRFKLIRAYYGVDLAKISDPLCQSILSIVLWYRLCQDCGFTHAIKIGSVSSLGLALGRNTDSVNRKTIDVDLATVNTRKPYYGSIYTPVQYTFEDMRDIVNSMNSTPKKVFTDTLSLLSDQTQSLLIQGNL